MPFFLLSVVAVLGSCHYYYRTTEQPLEAVYDSVKDLAQGVIGIGNDLPAEYDNGLFVKGKLLVINGQTGGIDNTHYKLPMELRANTAAEVSTIAVLEWKEARIGVYNLPGSTMTNNAPGAYQRSCSVVLIDRTIPVVVSTKEFTGSPPPAKKRASFLSASGSWPTEDVIRHLSTLPRRPPSAPARPFARVVLKSGRVFNFASFKLIVGVDHAAHVLYGGDEASAFALLDSDAVTRFVPMWNVRAWSATDGAVTLKTGERRTGVPILEYVGELPIGRRWLRTSDVQAVEFNVPSPARPESEQVQAPTGCRKPASKPLLLTLKSGASLRLDSACLVYRSYERKWNEEGLWLRSLGFSDLIDLTAISRMVAGPSHRLELTLTDGRRLAGRVDDVKPTIIGLRDDETLFVPLEGIRTLVMGA